MPQPRTETRGNHTLALDATQHAATMGHGSISRLKEHRKLVGSRLGLPLISEGVVVDVRTTSYVLIITVPAAGSGQR